MLAILHPSVSDETTFFCTPISGNASSRSSERDIGVSAAGSADGDMEGEVEGDMDMDGDGDGDGDEVALEDDAKRKRVKMERKVNLGLVRAIVSD